jgi:hypothetical protein
MNAIPWGTNSYGTKLVSDQRWQARPEAVGASCDIGAYEVAGVGPQLSAWVTGIAPTTAVCKNVTTGQQVTLYDPGSAWDCEAVGLEVAAGDRVSLLGHGPVRGDATDVSGAVTGMAPTSGSCTNLTTGQQVTFQHLRGATAASCVAAGLDVEFSNIVLIRVQGGAE